MSPRDGLQNEARPIPTADKIRLVDMLSACGFAKIETASFVSPKWVPQMADGREVLAGIRRRPGVLYTGICPNMKGYENARERRRRRGGGVRRGLGGVFARQRQRRRSRRRWSARCRSSRRRGRDGIPCRGYVSRGGGLPL